MSRKIINFLLLITLFLFSPILLAETVGEYLQKGEKKYKEKDYTGALNHFKEALELNPSSTKAHLGFAKSSLALGSLGDAAVSYKFVLDNDPGQKEAISGFAEVLSLSGKNRDALELIEAALKDEPYNQLLLVARPNILLRMGQYKTALKRLEDARSKINENYEFLVTLAKAYAANKKYESSKEIIEKLINKHPDNPEVFMLKAQLLYELASKETDQEKLMDLMTEAKELLGTSISLDPGFNRSKRLLMKNHIWLSEDNLALQVCEQLLEEFPNDDEILYYSAFLYSRLGNEQKAAVQYGKLLKVNDLDSAGRFAAEEFAKKNLNEKHPLRTNLGRYRLDQYEKDLEEFFYKNASFHIHRAHTLFPENKFLKKQLADYYYKIGDRKNLIRLLLNLREDDPDDIKINNRLEAVLKKIRESLAFKEGYLEKDASLTEGLRSEPEIFIFDLSPSEFIPSYPDESLIVTKSIKYALSLVYGLKVISGEEEEKIRTHILQNSNKARFTDSLYYSPDSTQKLNEVRKKDSMIRYVGYGKYKTSQNSISVEFNVYDRMSGKIVRNLTLSGYGRNGLADISVRLADSIFKIIPQQAKVLKIKKNSIILNVGFRDGIHKGDRLVVESKGTIYGNCEIIQSDEYISEAVFIDKGSNWRSEVGEGFRAYKISKVKETKD